MDKPSAELLAHEQLIRAAPDLLAAARDLVEVFANFEMDQRDKAIFEQLQAAVAKATSP